MSFVNTETHISITYLGIFTRKWIEKAKADSDGIDQSALPAYNKLFDKTEHIDR